MKLLVGFIFVLLIDFTVCILCKSAKKETKLERPDFIKIRGKKIVRELFEKQQKLDDLILKNLCKRVNMDITHRQLLDKRLLATYVEIGEFIEEQDHQKKLFEWVDVLHFLLSDGLALEISDVVSKHDINILYAKAKVNNQEIAIKDFLVEFSIFCNITRTFKYWSNKGMASKKELEKQYMKVFIAYFGVCKAYKYSVEAVRMAYNEKLNINIQRQGANY